MQIHSVWYRSGQDDLSPCRSGAAARFSFGRSSHRSSYWYSRRTCRPRLIGLEALRRSPLSRPRTAQAGSRCSSHPSPVREAVCEVQQERLRRRRGHRRSGRAQEHALCADQDRCPTGSASDPSRFEIDWSPAYSGHHQIRAFLLERGMVFAQKPAKAQGRDGGSPGERRSRP